MKQEISIKDIQNAIKKCEKGFKYFDKKRRVYHCDECDECYEDNCHLKGKYHYRGDNKWHSWQGSPNQMICSEKIFNELCNAKE